MSTTDLRMEVTSGLVKVGGVIALILGIVDMLRGLAILFFASVLKDILEPILAGTFLASILPFLPVIGGVFAIGSLILGVIAIVAGYILSRLDLALLNEAQRNRVIIFCAIIAALSLLLQSPWLFIAIAISLAGILLAPKPLPPPSQPPTGPK